MNTEIDAFVEANLQVLCREIRELDKTGVLVEGGKVRELRAKLKEARPDLLHEVMLATCLVKDAAVKKVAQDA